MSGRQRRRLRESASQELARVQREYAATSPDAKAHRRFLRRRIERLQVEIDVAREEASSASVARGRMAG